MDIGKTSIINASPGNTGNNRAFVLNFQNNGSTTIAAQAIPYNDSVTISKAAYALNADTPNTAKSNKTTDETTLQKNRTLEQNDNTKSQTQLSEDDLKQVNALKKRDSEVRRHEAAHLAAAGKYATGGASYEYKRGPDGKNYAAGGEVSIDTSPIAGDPQATIQKAQQIKAAAQAPANPSSQDRQVAASAAQMEAKARQEVSDLTPNHSVSAKADSENKETAEVATAESLQESATNKQTNNTPAASAYSAIDALSSTQNKSHSAIQLTA